jgi:hypothetical protein
VNTHTWTSHLSRSCVLHHGALPCLSSSFPISSWPHLYVWQARRGVIHALTDGVVYKYIYEILYFLFFFVSVAGATGSIERTHPAAGVLGIDGNLGLETLFTCRLKHVAHELISFGAG